MSCGHPVQCIVSSDEGTAYCRWCALEAEIARLREELTRDPREVANLKFWLNGRLPTSVFDLWRNNPPGEWDDNEAVTAVLDALCNEGIRAWNGDGVGIVVQIIKAQYDRWQKAEAENARLIAQLADMRLTQQLQAPPEVRGALERFLRVHHNFPPLNSKRWQVAKSLGSFTKAPECDCDCCINGRAALAAVPRDELAQERARCARIADAVAADFCADPDLPSGCQAAKTIADAIRSGEDAPSDLATRIAKRAVEFLEQSTGNTDANSVFHYCYECLAAEPEVAAALKGE